ncbi:MAG: CotH kinase family protein [Planctomycetes bacterium]|nr:CotH kinase family protein [Planctomycetota bacterium]
MAPRGLLLLALAFPLASLRAAAQAPLKPSKDQEATEAWFRAGPAPKIVVELDDAACEALRTEPRKYVIGRLRENDRAVFEGVGIKLKGSAGSFREFDETPSLSVRVNRLDDEQVFHGLRRLVLNKSVQDGAYLRELLGSELFRAAGIVSPRVAHARVWINKRDMGVYVLKEGYDRTLLKRGFEKSWGNLYDGGFCQDIDAELERDEGKGPGDRKDLTALLEACREPDLVKRWGRVEELVDIKAFLTYMAMELMLGHWDGYCLNRNNYRVYFDPATGKAYFLPHGMDQVLQDAEASILENPSAILADAVMKNPAWRAEYRKRVGELLPLFNADRLKKRVDEMAKKLAPVLEAWDKEQARAHEGEVASLKSIIEARERSLKEQKAQPDPRPLVFSPGVPVRVARWRKASECEDATLTAEKEKGVDLLRIACGRSGRCIAAFRRSVLLAAGHYRFQALVRTRDVVELEGEEWQGAGLRISGSGRENKLLGSADFARVDFEFEVTEEARDVELIVELRCSKGEMAVRADSLVLTKLK